MYLIWNEQPNVDFWVALWACVPFPILICDYALRTSNGPFRGTSFAFTSALRKEWLMCVHSSNCELSDTAHRLHSLPPGGRNDLCAHSSHCELSDTAHRLHSLPPGGRNDLCATVNAITPFSCRFTYQVHMTVVRRLRVRWDPARASARSVTAFPPSFPSTEDVAGRHFSVYASLPSHVNFKDSTRAGSLFTSRQNMSAKSKHNRLIADWKSADL
jgi:hypothetical protein